VNASAIRRITVALVIFVTTALSAAAPPNAEIRKILVDRIDVQHQSVGIVVGVIEPAGRRVVSYGVSDPKTANTPVDGNTLFEIGSATKVFTSLLLADAVQRGEVKLDDPVSKYLPSSVKVPERGGKQITLIDLATHTSGLPRLPDNLTPQDPDNPYVDYTVEQLYDFLSKYKLPRDIGSQYEYSNLGVGLLGHALARRANTDYATLVRKRVLDPLQMKSTVITVPPSMKSRFAVAHDDALQPTSNWDLPTLAGAGALRSTANDLLNLLGAFMGYTSTPLTPAMTSMLKPRRPTGTGGEVALAWHLIKNSAGTEFVFHSGGTGGYRAFMGFDPKNRVGVVVLSNAGTIAGVDDIGRHILDPASPLLTAQVQAKVDPAIFDHLVGRYEIVPQFVLTITHDAEHLYLQATGQPRFEIYPKSEREYFMKVVDAQITFAPDVDGRAPSLVLHQNGRDMTGKRLEGEAPAPKEHKEITVDAKVLDRYPGRYQLAPGFVITITRDVNGLSLQATGQPKFPLFAESEKDFFLKVVDAQITFEVDEAGKASALVLHQNGMDQRASKLE